MANFMGRIKHAWNAFVNLDPQRASSPNISYGSSYGYRPDRIRLSFGNERTLLASIYTRLSIDFSGADIRHVKTDDQGRYIEEMGSSLNECFKIRANIDQMPRHFRRDVALTLFGSGVAAIVPVDTTLNPVVTGSYDIQSMRVGTVVDWMPQHVTVRLYNDRTGRAEDVTLPKEVVAIVENPFYSVMNEPNSTLQRLSRKLSLLDTSDDQVASGKIDIIIQMPYTIKSEARRAQAQQRRDDIELQLRGSQYGIAYADAAEKITQLNRPAENNLLQQVELLTAQLYSELGLTPEVMNGTADEAAMLNYHERTIRPLLDAVVESMIATFLTKTARTQKQTIMYFRDPFKLVPLSQVAEIADKMTRNEILTSNEIRQGIGFKPVQDKKADELRNSNMPQPNGPAQQEVPPKPDGGPAVDEEEEGS